MTEFERFARQLSLPALAEALVAQDHAKLQGVYASLPDEHRDAVGLAVLDAGPLDLNRLRHLRAVCASATLPAALQAATSDDPGLVEAALDVIDRLAFADPALAGPIVDFYDSVPPVARDRWIRVLGTLCTPAAVERLEQLSHPAATEELGRLGHVTDSAEAEADRALQTGLAVRDAGRTVRPDELALLLTHRKLGLVWQLLDAGQIPPALHAQLAGCAELAQSKSERRFARRILLSGMPP